MLILWYLIKKYIYNKDVWYNIYLKVNTQILNH